MKKNSILGLFILLVFVAALLTSCAAPASPTPSSTPGTPVSTNTLAASAAAQASPTPSNTPVTPVSTNTPAAGAPAQGPYTDPFAYCAAVGTLDKPDARYVGQALPDVLMQGYIKASGASPDAAADANFRKMTIWRCMQGKVYVCNFGANLPCDSKADTNKNPTQAIIDFCKENLDSVFVPMAVTGHSTIYGWHCVKDMPEILNQLSQVDAAGFLANIWYPVEPGP